MCFLPPTKILREADGEHFAIQNSGRVVVLEVVWCGGVGVEMQFYDVRRMLRRMLK